MVLAHTGSTGPHVEYLVLGGAMILLGVLFFFQKSAKPPVSIILVLIGFALVGGAFILQDDGGAATSAEATVTIASPEDGATVPADEPVTIEVSIEGGSLTAEASSDDPNEGHLHVFVDGDLVSMPTEDVLEVELEPGERTIEVEFTRADHTSHDPPVVTRVDVRAE